MREDGEVVGRAATAIQIHGDVRYITEDRCYNTFKPLFALREYNRRSRSVCLPITVESQRGESEDNLSIDNGVLH